MDLTFRRVASRAPVPPARRRAVRTFWVLVVVAMAATGSVSAAVAAPPGALTAVRFAVSVVVGLGATALAVRIMLALGRRAPQPTADGQAQRPDRRPRTVRASRP